MYFTSCILKKNRQRVYKRFISWINFEIYNEVYNEDQLPLRRMRGYCYIVVKKLISCFLKSRLTVSQNFNTKECFGLVSCKLSIAKYYSKIIRTTFTIIMSERFFFQCVFPGYWTVFWVLGLLVYWCTQCFIFRFVITWSNSIILKLKNKFLLLITWQTKNVKT